MEVIQIHTLIIILILANGTNLQRRKIKLLATMLMKLFE